MIINFIINFTSMRSSGPLAIQSIPTSCILERKAPGVEGAGSGGAKETKMPLFGKLKIQVYFSVIQRVRAHLKNPN